MARSKTRQPDSCPPDLIQPDLQRDWWRPEDPNKRPVCGYTFDDKTCAHRGPHYCEPRADRVVAFFRELLRHTKGPHARKPFILKPWQEWRIVRPLFGEVIWSEDWGCYVRRYVVAGIIVARKNGKSELAAGLALYMLVGDDEEAAEVYGGAADTKQAGKVWQPARRMSELSPVLSKRLGVNIQSRRIYDQTTASYYEIIAADAKGELGHNPHAFVLDEVLSQPDDTLWVSLRTGAGARLQPLFIICSTETDEPNSFGANIIDELERVQQDPSRNERWFSFVCKLDMDADPWDEANWVIPNPALGDFLSMESLRQEAKEARLDPTKENAFRQFRLNQRVQQKSRWMPLHRYDMCGGPMVDEKMLLGKPCFGGLDLSAVSDLTCLAWWFPDAMPTDEPGPHVVLWRFWIPEAKLPSLSKQTGGLYEQWAKLGFIRVTEGDMVDYDAVHQQIERDAERFKVEEIGLDRWNAAQSVAYLEKKHIKTEFVAQSYSGMSAPLKEIMRLTQGRSWNHQGHPVARACFDAVEVRRDDSDNIRPVKPDRGTSAKRIDGVAACANAVARWLEHRESTRVKPFVMYA